MTWGSHVPLLKVYSVHLMMCVGFVFYMQWKHGPGDLLAFISYGAIAAAVLIGPALLLHIWYIFRSRSTKLTIGPLDQLKITTRTGQRTFRITEISALTAHKTFPVAENRTHWMPWDDLWYYDIVIDGERWRLTSLVVKNLEDLLDVPPDRYRLRKRFVPIP